MPAIKSQTFLILFFLLIDILLINLAGFLLIFLNRNLIIFFPSLVFFNTVELKYIFFLKNFLISVSKIFIFLEKHTIKERARKLRMEGLKNLKKHLSTKIGQKDLILVENNYNKKSIGKDQHFLKVELNEKINEGSIISCIYTGIQNDTLLAKKI